MDTIRHEDLLLIKEAVETQLRLLRSYINKSQRNYEQIARFEGVLDRVSAMLLNQ